MIIRKQIDLKHGVEVKIADDLGEMIETAFGTLEDHIEVEIVKRKADGTSEPIPEGEPTILFRGRDRLAVPMLQHYRTLCVADGCNDFQLGQVNELIARFEQFAASSPTMKQPGITRGL
jgi:hypothetical protein